MDVKKLFNRRSTNKEKDGTQESFAHKLRRRSRSRPRQSQVAQPQDDPLTSTYAQPQEDDTYSNGTSSTNAQPSSSRSRISGPAPERQLPVNLQNGAPKDEGLPGQAITIDEDNDFDVYPEDAYVLGHSQTSLPDASGRSRSHPRHQSIYAHPSQGHSSSSHFEEDVATRNMKRNQAIPPVPPLPQSGLNGISSAGQSSSLSLPRTLSNVFPQVSDTQDAPPRMTSDVRDSNPIAAEVGSVSPVDQARRAKRKSKFSSASYYMRQNSPPPSFSHDQV